MSSYKLVSNLSLWSKSMNLQEVLLLNVYSIQVKFQLIIIWIFRMRLLFHYFTAYINSLITLAWHCLERDKS